MTDSEKNNIIDEITKTSEGELSVIELAGVVYKIKPTMAEMVNFDKFDKTFIKKLDKINGLCKKLGLHFVVSTKKFIINSPLGIFEMVDMNDPRKGKIAMGISASKADALEGVNLYYKKTLSNEGSKEFGRIMGYPECCLDFGDYLCNPEEDKNNFGFKNPAVESLKRSTGFAWQCNVFTESPLSYYPCSLTCRESINYVNKLMKILEKFDPQHYESLLGYLKKPAALYWTCADKIMFYGNFKGDLRSGEVRYDKVEDGLISWRFYQENDRRLMDHMKEVLRRAKQGNRLVMRPTYFEIYKDKQRLVRHNKKNKYVPVLVKPDR